MLFMTFSAANDTTNGGDVLTITVSLALAMKRGGQIRREIRGVAAGGRCRVPKRVPIKQSERQL